MNPAIRLAAAGDDTRARLPGSLHVNRRLSQWLSIRGDGHVDVRPGKVELGQGIVTALAQIVAEELEVSLSRIRMVAACTGESPDEAVTSGSLSIQECGTALRYVCAEARSLHLQAAAAKLGVDPGELSIDDGDIACSDGRRTSYWALAEDGLLERDATASVPPRAPGERRVVGRSVARLDLPDKVFGRARYVHDLRLAGMLHGRVLRPSSPGAAVESLDDSSVRALPGVVAVVRDGSFVGVLAEREETAVAALDRLRGAARWREEALLPGEVELEAWLQSQPVETTVIAERGSARPAEGVDVQRTFAGRYRRPFTAHASIAPSCALARWDGRGALHVWSHSQGVYNLRTDLALALGVAVDAVVVQHVEGAGCYGHNAADDVALDAALLARAAGGRPVRVQWSREDELAWAPFGPAMVVDIEADVDSAGRLLAWRCEVTGNGHGTRPGRAKTPALLAAAYVENGSPLPVAVNPALASGGGGERNAVPLYDVAGVRAVNHRLLSMPIRASALRSLGAYANVFAIESMIDEIAHAYGVDPVEYRLRHLPDPRARAVIEAAARRAGWGAPVAGEGTGRGIGFARYKNAGAYCAVVADVEVQERVRVRRLTVAVDVGDVVNPDGVANQIEGGAIQATSWTLLEAVRFDTVRVTSRSWEDYPILAFSDVPDVDVEIVARPDCASVGAGEAAMGPTAGAIANAVAAALAVRPRTLPLTPERILSAAQGR